MCVCVCVSPSVLCARGQLARFPSHGDDRTKAKELERRVMIANLEIRSRTVSFEACEGPASVMAHLLRPHPSVLTLSEAVGTLV